MSDNIFKDLAAPIPKHLVKTLTTKYTDKKTKQEKSFSVSYITARTVMNRLDEVVGPENWKTEFTSEGLPPKTILCKLYIRINGEWLCKSDVGTMTDVEPEKGMISDAIKRAAVHWGIARELYREGVANLDDSDTTTVDEHGEVVLPPQAQPGDTDHKAPVARKTTPPRNDPPSRGVTTTAAQNDAPSDLDAVVWTRDTDTLDRMVSWAVTFKKCTGKEHARNLICKALDLDTPNGDRDEFNRIMAEQFRGSKDDAIAAITAYEHGSN